MTSLWYNKISCLNITFIISWYGGNIKVTVPQFHLWIHCVVNPQKLIYTWTVSFKFPRINLMQFGGKIKSNLSHLPSKHVCYWKFGMHERYETSCACMCHREWDSSSVNLLHKHNNACTHAARVSLWFVTHVHEYSCSRHVRVECGCYYIRQVKQYLRLSRVNFKYCTSLAPFSQILRMYR